MQVKADYSDLEGVVKALLGNPARMQRIADTAYQRLVAHSQVLPPAPSAPSLPSLPLSGHCCRAENTLQPGCPGALAAGTTRHGLRWRPQEKQVAHDVAETIMDIIEAQQPHQIVDLDAQ